MRLAILADVHADLHALRDALRQIERLGCEGIVCAGDLVGYGLFPKETIRLVRERSIPCVRGNHDRWAVSRGRPDHPQGRAEGEIYDLSGFDLPEAALRFLADLPPGWHSTIEGVRVAVRHGTPRSDMDGIVPEQATPADVARWLEEAAAEVLIVGHTHTAFTLSALGDGLVLNPGALLRDPAVRQTEPAWIFDPEKGSFAPAPPPEAGTFGILELPSKRFTVHRATDGSEVEIQRVMAGVVDRRGHRS